MGYTHYWTFKKSGLKASEVEKLYQQAVKDVAKVVLYAKQNVVNLSGYTAHTEISQYGGIDFNGVKEEAHENFYMREHFKQNDGFNFCKTARKEYDVVVVAAIAILKYRLGSNIEVSSDGYFEDWTAGIELARKVLKRKILNPISPDNIVELKRA